MKRISLILFIVIMSSYSFPEQSYAYGGRYNSGDFIGTLFIISIISLVFFLLMREVFCWYAKINERLAVLKEIRDSLKKLHNVTDPSDRNIISNGPKVIENVENIKSTGETSQEIYEQGFCPSCGNRRSQDGGRCPECNENFFDYAKEAYKKGK